MKQQVDSIGALQRSLFEHLSRVGLITRLFIAGDSVQLRTWTNPKSVSPVSRTSIHRSILTCDQSQFEALAHQGTIAPNAVERVFVRCASVRQAAAISMSVNFSPAIVPILSPQEPFEAIVCAAVMGISREERYDITLRLLSGRWGATVTQRCVETILVTGFAVHTEAELAKSLARHRSTLRSQLRSERVRSAKRLIDAVRVSHWVVAKRLNDGRPRNAPQVALRDKRAMNALVLRVTERRASDDWTLDGFSSSSGLLEDVGGALERHLYAARLRLRE